MARMTQAAAARFLVTTFHSGFATAFLYAYFIGIVAAPVIMGVALWRNRSVPRWLAVLVTVSLEVAQQVQSKGIAVVLLQPVVEALGTRGTRWIGETWRRGLGPPRLPMTETEPEPGYPASTGITQLARPRPRLQIRRPDRTAKVAQSAAASPHSFVDENDEPKQPWGCTGVSEVWKATSRACRMPLAPPRLVGMGRP
jgi:hypothetical protein